VNQDINESREAARRVAGAVLARQVASDTFDDAFSEFLGINRTDARCLSLLDREGRMTAGKLATESGLTTGAVTIVLDRLEKAGYVRRVRDPDDRRKVHVEMTAEMRDIRGRVLGHFDKLMPAVLGAFSSKQIEGIVAFMELSALINRALCGILKEQIASASAATSAADRQERARSFERAAKGAVSRLGAGARPKAG
jgi:DNA-binding MarR family transcriptional regulator